MIKNPNRIWWAAVLVAWSFDFLFWQKSPGVSIFIFTILILVVGLVLSRLELVQSSKSAYWLLFPVLFFSLWAFIRQEPFTTFTNILLSLVALGIYAHTFLAGRWLKYSLSDYVAAFFYLFLGAFLKPVESLMKDREKAGDEGGQDGKRQAGWRRSLPILRGLLIAVPVLAIFASLFAAADPIFEAYLGDFVDLFQIEKLPEYIFRSVYILILGYLLSGIYLHAFTHNREDVLIGEEKPWVPRFLGYPEAVIVLGSVDLLFAFFVGIQFRYFFGGQSNIKVDAFTFAEYARRGFGELVAVSVISLLLFLIFSTISRRQTRRQRRVFSGLGIGLFLLVGVILVSAFQRLLLYEQAYGFTRLRTYSHVFMIWLGVLLASVVVLELLRKQRAFALAGFLAAMGFVISLNILNVDRLIVDQNIYRALIADLQEDEVDEGHQETLDTSYLYSLSRDVTAALIDAQQNPQLSVFHRNELAAVLACQIVEITEHRRQLGWQSFHLADEHAWQLLMENRDNFRAARVYHQQGSWWVKVNENRRPCQHGAFGFD